MTLHWWMHWFWVTMLLTVLATTRENHAAPRPDGVESERQARAMYFTKTQPYTTRAPPSDDAPVNVTKASDDSILNATGLNVGESVANASGDRPIDNAESTPVGNIAETNIDNRSTGIANESNAGNVSGVNPPSNVTGIQWTPIVTEAPRSTETPRNTTARRRNLTRPMYTDLSPEGAAESRIVTEKPLSLETAFLQTRVPPVESSRRVIESGSGLDTGAIAGISFAALAAAALAGSTLLVLYRRRFLNKPQTLNDKCSNPDSSGYLDDSTIRDNSEEMYSLDNDSFLNSLEAMTIQNYWTDTVKHTKL